MVRNWPCVLATALLLLAPLYAPGQGKKKADVGAPATEEDYKQLAKATDAIGKLGSPVGKSVTLVVEFKNIKVDQAKLAAAQAAAQKAMTSGVRPTSTNVRGGNPAQQMAHLQQQYMQLMQSKTPQQYQQHMHSFMQAMQKMQMQMAQVEARQAQQMQQMMMQMMQKQAQAQQNLNKNSPYSVEVTTKTYEFNIRDDVIVRRMSPPSGYDDKGNVKQYSTADLQKLKGTNAKLPGYEAKIEDLEPGQTVQVFLAPPKEGKVGDVDLVGNPIRQEVRMIVLAAEEPAGAGLGLGLGGGVNAPGLPKQ